MSSILSATTNSVAGTASSTSRRDRFFDSAHELLASARADVRDGALDNAMENAYRAALRVAGAVNADSPVIQKRKRLPTNAWKKLALTSGRGSDWAKIFSAFSAQRGRIASGIETHPDPAVVENLISLAEQFLEESLPGSTVVPLVA